MSVHILIGRQFLKLGDGYDAVVAELAKLPIPHRKSEATGIVVPWLLQKAFIRVMENFTDAHRDSNNSSLEQRRSLVGV
jgi:hypothetical protein